MLQWMSGFLTIANFVMLNCKNYPELNLRGVEYKEKLLYNLTGQRTNLTHLLEQYSAICPLQKQCNLFSANIKDLERPEVVRAFPQCNCSCSYNCVLNHNCCPGNIYGYLRHTCINVGIFHNDTGNQYLMVSDCPPSNVTDEDVVEKCTSEKQSTAPVTSYMTNITYRNIYCAHCNGEHFVTYWDIHIKCEIKPPNLFKTLLSVVSLKAKYNCSASHWLNTDKEMSFRPVECRATPSKSMFESCNQTGLWLKDDETIDWACKSLDSRFYHFKNAFCYICNPSVASRYEHRLNDTCGSIGGRHEVTMGLKHLCESRPFIQRLAPYKNVYCMLCNGYSFSHKYLGSNIVTETVTDSNSSTVNLTVIVRGTDIWKIMHILNDVYGNIEMSMKTYRSSESNRYFPNQKMQNKLIEAYIQACGDKGLCGHPKGKKPKIQSAGIPVCGTCSCYGNCTENRTCCPDLIIKNQPYTCVDVKDFVTFPPDLVEDNSLSSATVVDRCINRAKTKNVQLCEVDGDEKFKLTSFMPITINHSNMVYKNIYCYLCNRDNEDENNTLSVNITLYCKTLIEPNRFTDLKSMLNASLAFCNTSFVPYNAQPCKSRSDNKSTESLNYTDWRSDILTYTRNHRDSNSHSVMNTTRFANCNETINSQHERYIIKSVCEGTSESILALPVYKYNFNIYKNFACFVCNRAFPSSSFNSHVISGCRSNASHDSVLQCEKRNRDSLWMPYKNYFCADCNLSPLYEMANPKSLSNFPTTIKTGIPTVNPTTNPLPTTAAPRPPPTFRFLFSIHHEDWARVESHVWTTLPSCDNGTYDQTLGSCRQLYCDEGRTLENSTCHVFSEVAANIVYAIKINLSPVEAFHTSNETIDLHAVTICEDMFRMCTGTILNILDTSHKLVSCNITTNSQCETNDTIVMTPTSYLHMVLNVEIVTTRNLTMVETELIHCLDMMYDVRVHEICNITFQSSFLTDFEERNRDIQGSICKVNISGNDSKDMTENPFQITHLMLCPQVELNEDEFEFNNETGTVFIEQNSLNKTEEEFRWHDSSIRICQYDQPCLEYRKRSKTIPTLMKQYALFSQIAIALSLACLFLTFVTYCIFPVLRTLPGKNIMVLTYNLFLAQAFLIFVSRIGDSRIICTASGICLHYFWLSTFCAMNVCSYHMFKIFCLRLFESHSRVIHRMDFFRYLAYIHGAPVVVIVSTVTVHLSITLGTFTGYGSRHGCFLSNNYSVIFAFLLPATASFLMNIVFFLSVARKIRSSPSVARSTDKNDFLICVKICVIVGVSWPLQTVDGMLELSVLSFVATALNGLQGVYIFISYVCNRRVIGHYISLIGRIRSPKLQTGTSVTSSSEPIPSPTSLTTSTSLSQLTFESNSKM